MERYEVIVVSASQDEFHDEYSRIEELSRYLYGRSFFLGVEESDVAARPGRTIHDFYFLVESYYVDSIIPRLASGLFYARKPNQWEREKVLN